MEALLVTGFLFMFVGVVVLVIYSTKHNHCMKCVYNKYHKRCDNNESNKNIIDRWK